jgi:hypothetical protein
MSNKPGRPPEQPDPIIVQEILDWIEDGRTLREYCRQADKPTFKTVYRWMEKDEEFKTRFVRARDVGEDAIAQDTLHLIDQQPDRIVSESGISKIDPGWVQYQRNRVEQRMKLLAVWNPRKYGAKVDLTTEGKQVGLNITIDMSDDENATKNTGETIK